MIFQMVLVDKMENEQCAGDLLNEISWYRENWANLHAIPSYPFIPFISLHWNIWVYFAKINFPPTCMCWV